jgi:hypothetical protein
MYNLVSRNPEEALLDAGETLKITEATPSQDYKVNQE